MAAPPIGPRHRHLAHSAPPDRIEASRNGIILGVSQNADTNILTVLLHQQRRPGALQAPSPHGILGALVFAERLREGSRSISESAKSNGPIASPPSGAQLLNEAGAAFAYRLMAAGCADIVSKCADKFG